MSLPYNHKLIPQAKALRNHATEQEKRLWYKYLSQYPIRFQRQKTIGRYIADALGIDYYDSELIKKASLTSGLSEEIITNHEERFPAGMIRNRIPYR